MVHVFAKMTMDVRMGPAVGVMMCMEMEPFPPQAKKHLSAKQDQHHADYALQHLCQGPSEPQIQKDSRTGKDEQSQRMAEAPNCTMSGDPANGSRAGAKRRYGRHVISLQGMLHAEQ